MQGTSVQHTSFIPYQQTQHREVVADDAHIIRLKARYSEFLEALTTLHVCVTCKQEYFPTKNYNGYFCYVHKGFLDATDRWECCGESRYSNGCVPSIHFKQMSVKEETKLRPLMVLNVPKDLVDLGIVRINRWLFSEKYAAPDALEDCYQMYCLKHD